MYAQVFCGIIRVILFLRLFWFPRATGTGGTRTRTGRPDTAGRLEVGPGRWNRYQNSCELSVLCAHTYFVFSRMQSQPAPDA